MLITIIILIILAAITIKIIFDIDFVNLATKSVENYAGAQSNELGQMNNTVDKLENTIDKIKTANPSKPGEVTPENPSIVANGSWDNAKGVNSPKLTGTGMTAVYFKDDGSMVELTTSSSQEEWNNWYDYADTSIKGANTSKWANAVTKNENKEITGYFVWIPRYEYKIDTSNKTIEVNFKKIEDSTTPGFTMHPAFGINKEQGGWRKELEGFWVAKYPAGWQQGQEGRTEVVNESKIQKSGLTYTIGGNYNGITSNYLTENLTDTSPITYPVFLPQTYAYNCISVGDMYRLSREIQNATSMYGLGAGVDSHLEKNSEWGAVVYLTHSKYGVNGNSSNMNEVTMNTKNLNNEIKVKNDPSKTSINSNVYAVTGYGGQVAGDVSASSTKNASGVYDLNGCIWEYTTGYFKGGSSEEAWKHWHEAMATSSTANSSEYVTLYGTTGIEGDATTQTAGWSNYYLWFVSSYCPVFVRRLL